VVDKVRAAKDGQIALGDTSIPLSRRAEAFQADRDHGARGKRKHRQYKEF